MDIENFIISALEKGDYNVLEEYEKLIKRLSKKKKLFNKLSLKNIQIGGENIWIKEGTVAGSPYFKQEPDGPIYSYSKTTKWDRSDTNLNWNKFSVTDVSERDRTS